MQPGHATSCKTSANEMLFLCRTNRLSDLKHWHMANLFLPTFVGHLSNPRASGPCSTLMSCPLKAKFKFFLEMLNMVHQEISGTTLHASQLKQTFFGIATAASQTWRSNQKQTLLDADQPMILFQDARLLSSSRLGTALRRTAQSRQGLCILILSDTKKFPQSCRFTEARL